MDEGAPDRTDCETAYAKLNLALHVRERMAGGYHRIETIFAFLDQGDLLTVQPADRLELDIGGPFAEGLSKTDNLVLDAARRLAEQSGIDQGACLHLDKRLPVASGIGGGSADAAAALRLLNRFWGLDHCLARLSEMARPLGADVPACVISQACRGTGIGQDLAIIADDDLQDHIALLINPLVPVSTADIFASWDGIDRGPLGEGAIIPVARNGRNDLERPALALVPLLADVLAVLEECQPVIARMSGSGATCFALFETLAEAQQAEHHARQALGDIWTMVGKFR